MLVALALAVILVALFAGGSDGGGGKKEGPKRGSGEVFRWGMPDPPEKKREGDR